MTVRVVHLNRQYDQMQGRFKEMRKQILKEFGCKKLPEAVVLLEEIHAEMIVTSRTYVKMKKRYERELAVAKKKMKGSDED